MSASLACELGWDGEYLPIQPVQPTASPESDRDSAN